ncbi:MAG: HAD-IA family hydrolase [Bacilli bacterium]|nr:HAD-IA family hydrolase [Bacilli bacterium]
MKLDNKYSFIWDLDGTLIDSYHIIVNSIYLTYLKYGIKLDKDEVYKEVIKTSTKDFLLEMEKNYKVPYIEARNNCTVLNEKEKYNIKAMKHAYEILSYLNKEGIMNYVFTHKGHTSIDILKNNDLLDFFKEVVIKENGFLRKPAPDAINYLVEKYQLNKETTFYVGDRVIDVECAHRAGIKSILYLPKESVAIPNGKENYIVKDLLDIVNIIEEK